MKDGEVTKTPIKIGDNWVIVGVNKREDANMEEFAKQRDTLMEQMLEHETRRAFQRLSGLGPQAKMETDGKIKIYNDVIAKWTKVPKIHLADFLISD